MRYIGWGLTALAALLATAALVLDPAMHDVEGQRQQSLLIQGAIGAGIVGAILFGFDRISSKSSPVGVISEESEGIQWKAIAIGLGVLVTLVLLYSASNRIL